MLVLMTIEARVLISNRLNAWNENSTVVKNAGAMFQAMH